MGLYMSYKDENSNIKSLRKQISSFPRIDIAKMDEATRNRNVSPGVGSYNIDKPVSFIQSRNPKWSLSKVNRVL